MKVQVTINYEIPKEEMETLADSYLQMVVDKFEGDEFLYRQTYVELIEDDTDLLNYIEDYTFMASDEDFFTGLDIETQDLFALCKEVRKIVLEKMREDFKNLA